MTVAAEIRGQFAAQGYVGPIRVLSTSECEKFLHAVASEDSRPLDWDKAWAIVSRPFYELCVHSTIRGIVSAILGDDVMLWGASIQDRAPAAVHPWHTDIEASVASGKVVSVWLGLEHTHRNSALRLVARSHRFGVTVQEIRAQAGLRREEAMDDDIMRWARQREPRSDLVQPAMSDGEALFFDGALWHSSHNRHSETRRALLLQYATPDTPIHIPDLNNLDWPFRRKESPRPACVMLRGNDTAGVNRVAPAPVSAGTDSKLTSRVSWPQLPLPREEKTGWTYCPIFTGATSNLDSVSCHVSTLQRGCRPHPPHTHDEEELLLLLDGEVELTLPDVARHADRRMRLEPGQLVYYPAHFPHTLTPSGEGPASYMIFKWRNRSQKTRAPLVFGRYDAADHMEVTQGFNLRLVFEGATGNLRKLHCHATKLMSGAGYDAHIDAHDVAIIVLKGEVETLGQRLGPHAMIFYPAGEPHGLRNCGDATAEYVVYEFHGL